MATNVILKELPQNFEKSLKCDACNSSHSEIMLKKHEEGGGGGGLSLRPDNVERQMSLQIWGPAIVSPVSLFFSAVSKAVLISNGSFSKP